MRIIMIRYLGPTTYKWSRVKAWDNCRQKIIPYDHNKNWPDLARDAAAYLCDASEEIVDIFRIPRSQDYAAIVVKKTIDCGGYPDD